MIGPGVSQNASQHINLTESHGFNVGAAGMFPGITNNLHLHFTSETFLATSGAYDLRWGVTGEEGTLRINQGDISVMPTWIFRGFSTYGDEYGFLMTVLGGDDTGGIIWSPDVMQRARATGLWLGADNEMIDMKDSGSAPPPNLPLMPLMSPEEIAQLKVWTVAEMQARTVSKAERHYLPATLDAAMPASATIGNGWMLAPIVGHGLTQSRFHTPKIYEPQGFSIDCLKIVPQNSSAAFFTAEKMVIICLEGELNVTLNVGDAAITQTLCPQDILSIPCGVWRSFANQGTTEAHAVIVLPGDARKVPHFAPELVQAALANDVTLDANGYVCKASVLPPKVFA